MNTLLNNRYQPTQVLGQGGFGETFLAEDTYLPSRRRCVIKQLKPMTNDPQMYQLVKERFQREAAILENLGEGSNQIPKLYAYFFENGQFYLVQEWIQGVTLTSKVANNGPLPESLVQELLISLLPVLDYIHSKGIIHRDIKPDNIILPSSSSEPVLIDFGAVKETIATATNVQRAIGHSIVVGTPGFISPEQAVGRPVYASDIYSLGLTALYLLTGKQPQEFPVNPQTGQLLWQQTALHVSPQLAAILDKAIQPHLGDRYTTAQKMLDALRLTPATSPLQPPTQATVIVSPVARGTPQQPQPAPVINLPSPQTNWQRVFIVGSLLIGGLLVAGIVVSLFRQQPSLQTSSDQPVVKSTTPPESPLPPAEPTDTPPTITTPVPSTPIRSTLPSPIAIEPQPDRKSQSPQTPTPKTESVSTPHNQPTTPPLKPETKPQNDSTNIATNEIPAFPTGTARSIVEATLGKPKQESRGAWGNTRAVSYDNIVPHKVDLGYLYDRDSGQVRETEAGFNPSVEPQLMLTTLNAMLSGRVTDDIKQGLQRVQQRQSNNYTFTEGSLKGMIVRQNCDEVYISIWDGDLHDFDVAAAQRC